MGMARIFGNAALVERSRMVCGVNKGVRRRSSRISVW